MFSSISPVDNQRASASRNFYISCSWRGVKFLMVSRFSFSTPMYIGEFFPVMIGMVQGNHHHFKII